MLVDVEAFLFNTLVNAQAVYFLNSIEEYNTASGSP